MPKPAVVLDGITRALNTARSKVVQFDRAAMEAGFRAKAMRGRGGVVSEFSLHDAAIVLTAILSGEVNVTAENILACQKIRPLSAKRARDLYAPTKIPELAGLADDHSFFDVVEALLTAFSTGTLSEGKVKQPPIIEIGVIAPGPIADLYIAGTGPRVTDVRFAMPGMVGSPRRAAAKRWPRGLIHYRQITDAELIEIATIFHEGDV